MPAPVAIVMRCQNEMPHVRRALKMLNRQTGPAFDLTAVDSGSTDGSLEELQKYCDQLQQIAPDEYVPGKVLNNAIAQTRSEIIVLLNADAVPRSDNWLEKLLRPILENRADAAFSQQIARPDARFIVAYDYARAYNPAKIAPGFFSAVACAFRRELWERHRFPESGYAEDAAWAADCIAAGARFQLADDSVVEHSHNYTLQELRQKRRRQAPRIGNSPPGLGCELARDLLHAIAKMKPWTIPYNIAYRVTIHFGDRIPKGIKPSESGDGC